MNTLVIAVLASLALASASHYDDGQWHGHHGHDDGQWHGDGGWGGWDGGHSNVVHGNGATLVGPGVGHAVVSGPVHGGLDHGLGHVGVVGHVGLGHIGVGHLGLGAGHLGLGAGHLGLGVGHLGLGHGHGGVAVVGPHTVPAAIVGPSGKIVADGLYGVGHGHHGHHW